MSPLNTSKIYAVKTILTEWWGKVSKPQTTMLSLAIRERSKSRDGPIMLSKYSRIPSLAQVP